MPALQLRRQLVHRARRSRVQTRRRGRRRCRWPPWRPRRDRRSAGRRATGPKISSRTTFISGLTSTRIGRVDEIAVAARRVAAAQDRRALLLPRLDVGEHALVLLGRDQRAHHRVGGEARADLPLAGVGGHAPRAACRKCPCARTAASRRCRPGPNWRRSPSRRPARSCRCRRRAGRSPAILPPSSSVTRFSVSVAFRLMILPTSVEPVKATLSTSGWRTMRSPAVSPMPVTRLNDAGGDARLGDEVGEPQRGERRLLGGLEDDGAAGGERRARSSAPPSSAGSSTARSARRRRSARAGRKRGTVPAGSVGGLDMVAGQLGRPAGHVAQHPDRAGQIERRGWRPWACRCRSIRARPARRRGRLDAGRRASSDHPLALVRRQAAPAAVVERGPRRGDRAVDVGVGGVDELARSRLPGRGIVDGDRLVVGSNRPSRRR